ncbi:MAG: hypothetical protein RLZ63_1540 [Pseudomonadota bacterium]|jgi:TolA-binding protein
MKGKQVLNTKKLYSILLGLACSFGVSAQTDNCAIPGWPGCSAQDFNRAMQEQQMRNLMEEQVRQQRRSNQLIQEQNRLIEQQMLIPQQVLPNYEQLRMQRCLTMPLGTPGC